MRASMLVVPALLLTGCNLKSHSVPGAPLPFASVNYEVLGPTSAKACGSYVFGIDLKHLFTDSQGSAAGTDPISAVLSAVPVLGGPPEAGRAIYNALDKMPEATNLYAPKVHVTTTGLAPFGMPLFGKRCAEVEARGVKIGKGPVPQAQ
jgi:hypothetical protein